MTLSPGAAAVGDMAVGDIVEPAEGNHPHGTAGSPPWEKETAKGPLLGAPVPVAAQIPLPAHLPSLPLALLERLLQD